MKYHGGHFVLMFIAWILINLILRVLILAKGGFNNALSKDNPILQSVTEVIAFAVSIFVTALITPMISTGFIFNGPRHTVHALEPVFGAHQTVYNMIPGPLKAWETFSLSMFVIGWAIGAVFGTLGLVMMLVPCFAKVIEILGKVVGLIGLVLLVPGLLTFVGWICWVLMLLTGQVWGGSKSDLPWWSWHEQMVAFIQGNKLVPNVLDKIIHSCFGKLY